MVSYRVGLCGLTLAFAACLPFGGGSPAAQNNARPGSSVPADPFAAPELRAREPVDAVTTTRGPSVLVRHATVMTATGKRYAPGFVLMESGAIAAVGEGDGPPPKEGTIIVDAHGRFVTPGIIIRIRTWACIRCPRARGTTTATS